MPVDLVDDNDEEAEFAEEDTEDVLSELSACEKQSSSTLSQLGIGDQETIRNYVIPVEELEKALRGYVGYISHSFGFLRSTHRR